MRYGLLGEKLGHSFSREIHNMLGDYAYDLIEVARDDLVSFVRNGDFTALNVTIPYKEAIIPHLDNIDDAAEAIGAVNTVVKRDGRLCGYNTDFYGLEKLINHSKIGIKNRKIAILGTGGTSKTAKAVAEHLKASEILIVSREKRQFSITYDELYDNHSDVEVIINTTPVGMYPNDEYCPIELSKFDRLFGVIDVIYNPLRTPLIVEAKKKGIRAEGGLYMLVAQAVRASEIFLNTKYDEKTIDKIYRKLIRNKENIVLIGMPASGKSTVGRMLEKKLSRKVFDSDKYIEHREKISIPEIFATKGEEYFRDLESCVIKELSTKSGIIIATGGGSVLRDKNVDNLKKNGRLYFIDRPLTKLIPTSNRPLASNAKDIEKRYNERYGIYSRVADVRIDSNTSAPITADKIIDDYYS